MGWRDLRNAPLIEAFGRYSASPGAGLPPGNVANDSIMAAGVAACLINDGLLEEYQEALGDFGVNGWRLGTIGALMVWEDMHEILSCDIAHLKNLIKMFPDTELSARCEAALRFHTMVPSRIAALMCAEAKARPRRFA